MPEIIGFSNRLSYQDQPLIPLRQYGRDRLSPVLLTHYVQSGYQDRRKVNPVEAETVAEAVERCCDDPKYRDKSFGVISLLHSSDQDREIEMRLIKRLDAQEIEKRNLVCGDAYDFQGDERDVIFLSMVSARSAESRIGTMSDEKAKRRFNVAVSRARDQVQLFHSVQQGELGKSCLRRRLLEYMTKPELDTSVLPQGVENISQLRQIAHSAKRSEQPPPQPFDSWFEVDVFLSVAEQGHAVVPQYEVHGYYIDLVIIGGRRKIGVECDGDKWHGPEEYENDMRRQRELERCGWEFFRIRGSSYYRDPGAALVPLWEMLDDLERQETAGRTLEPSCEPETFHIAEESIGDRGRAEVIQGPAGTDNRLGAALEYAERRRELRLEQSAGANLPPGTSVTLDDVLALPSRQLGWVICEILEECPHRTSKKDDLVKRVCKHFGIRTRGGPRQKLRRKIGWTLSDLKKSGKVEEYKAKNTRVRLVTRPEHRHRL